MKKFLLIYLIILICTPLRGQMSDPSARDVASKKSIGEYLYAVSYTYVFALDTISDKRYTDIHVLEIGNNISRYYSQKADMIDSLLFRKRKDTKSHMTGFSAYQYLGKNERCLYEDFYLNYPNIGTLLCRTAIIDTEYEYTENIPIFKWDYIYGEENILGYNCKIAKTKFRGREYKVYFSEALPLSYGPWKFNGLPGIILKVEEETGLFKWEAIGITQQKGRIYVYDPQIGKTSEDIASMKIKKTSRVQVRKLQKMMWDNPIGLRVLHGISMSNYYIDLKTKQKIPFTQADWDKFREPYIPPLELE